MTSLACVPYAWAEEWLNFYPVSGELSVGFDGRWRETFSGQSYSQYGYKEQLALLLGGHVLDRRFFSFNARLNPALRQRYSSSPAGAIDEDSQFLNYGVSFSLLHGVPAVPLSLNASLSASNSETEDSLGNRQESIQEERVAGLIVKFTPFRSSLVYREREQDQDFISAFGLPPNERKEFQRTLTYRGHSRGMELFAEGTELDDRTVDDRDYEAGIVRLTNNFSWGKNSKLGSRLEYSTRDGFNAYETANVRENLQLQHTKNLYTAYSYAYTVTHRTTETERQSGNFQLNHRLYTNLVSNLTFGGSNASSSEQYREKNRNAGLDFQYTKKIKSGVQISANLGGGYEATDRTSGALDFSESATVPATGIVVLTQRFILWPSIIVTAPGCSPCLEGSDYFVEDAGGDYTQIRIPAGSRISIDDVISVDYVYEPPTVEFFGVPYRVGMKLKYGPFAFYHRTTGQNQTYVSGPDPTAVADRRTHTTGIQWEQSRGRAKVGASAEVIIDDDSHRTSSQYYLRQTLKYAVAPNAMLDIDLSQTFISNSTDAETYRGNMSLKWRPAPRLTVTPRLAAFRRHVEPDVTSSYLKTGMDVTWKWRQLSVDFLYDHTIWESNGDISTEDRVVANFKRNF